MLQWFTRIAPLSVLFLSNVALGGDLAPATELPVGGVFDIVNRFSVAQIVPESADTVTEVEMRARINVRLIERSERGSTFRFRFESLALDYAQLTPTAYNALRFDSEAEDAGFNENSRSLLAAIGQPIEFNVAPGAESDTLLSAVRTAFENDTAGNLFRMFLSERILSQSLAWIFDLGDAGHDAEVGDAFENVLYGRLLGEAAVEFKPQITIDASDGETARLSIGGAGIVKDARPVDAKLDGDPLFVPMTISVSGAGDWNIAERLLESLNLEAAALLEPDRIDPLGRRIERRRIQVQFEIRRVRDTE